MEKATAIRHSDDTETVKKAFSDDSQWDQLS